MTGELFDDRMMSRNDGMIAVAKVTELEFGKLKRYVVMGQPVLIIITAMSSAGLQISAFSSLCPHSLGDLSQGWVSGNEIECPLHYYRFNLQTGECT